MLVAETGQVVVPVQLKSSGSCESSIGPTSQPSWPWCCDGIASIVCEIEEHEYRAACPEVSVLRVSVSSQKGSDLMI